MNTLVSTVLSWARLSKSPLQTASPVTYHITEAFYDETLENFFEDRFLSLHIIGREDVRAMLRRAFDAWQHNVPRVSFVESDVGIADVIITASNLDADDVLAYARMNVSSLSIDVSSAHCWYGDSEFCHAVVARSVWLMPLMFSVWTVSSALLVCLLCRAVHEHDGPLRILLWTLTLAPPLFYWGALQPCLRCYDFNALARHEIGHLIYTKLLHR